MKTVSTENQRSHFFLACLTPLLATDLISTLISYHCSVDRGMWPLVLMMWIVVSFGYSSLTYLTAHLTRHFDVPMALRHHAFLGAALVVLNLAFYLAEPDWLAVNNGLIKLEWHQRVIHSDWTPWVFYLFSYLLFTVRLIQSPDKAIPFRP